MTLTTSDIASKGNRAAAVLPRQPAFAGSLIRPDDQIRLTFELFGGTVDPATNRIISLIEDDGIFFVVSFGSQHTAEASIGTDETPPDAALTHRRALPSRVSVGVPSGTEFTVGNLISLAQYALHVDPRADGSKVTTDAEVDEPAVDVTSIEIPTSLILSPPGDARFTARSEPAQSNGITELWRARLASASPDTAATVRAIAYRPGGPFSSDTDLERLVDQTTGRSGTPIRALELVLSSQGADVDLDGAWDSGVLAAYRHRVISGRDLRVVIVTRGYLAPFGHPASLTTLTERDLRTDSSGDLTASLVEDTYLAIAEPTVAYTEDFTALMPHDGRRLPFTSVAATDDGSGPVGQSKMFLPNGTAIRRRNASTLTRDGSDLVISYAATDRSGRDGITFGLPVVFVSDEHAYEPLDRDDDGRTVLGNVATWYERSADDRFRDLDLAGQAVAWADPSPRGGAGSVQTTNRVRISLDRPDTDETDADEIRNTLENVLVRPAFLPGVDRAWIVDQTSTTALGGDPPETEVSVAQRWLDHGTGSDNADLGYLDLDLDVGVPNVVAPTTDALGMLAASLNVGTFGQFLGAGFKFPGSGAGAWDWDPFEALADIGGGLPKLLGSIDLTDLIPSIDISALDLPDGLPAMKVEPRFDDPDSEIPTGVCFIFTWEPKIQSFPKGDDKSFVVTDDFADPLPSPKVVFDSEDGTLVRLELETCLPDAHTSFEASLERFALLLPPGAPVVAVCFEAVTFTNIDGRSDVSTDIADWSFVGALSWLEPLKDLLADLLGMGSSTFDGGIFVDYGIPVPDLKLGVLGISGMRVDLGLDLPDSGTSAMDLAVCSRDDPFRITIMGFGGDGSFGLGVDAREIVLIEASLAVTYELAVDVFIANASLSASLGVSVEYAQNRQGAGEVSLMAYATLHGSAGVLGLVEISGSVTVALIYNITTKVLRGVAAVTGEVSSIFGTSSVTHDVDVEVALGDGPTRLAALSGGAAPRADASDDLSFRDRFDRPGWDTYCAAFAPSTNGPSIKHTSTTGTSPVRTLLGAPDA